MSREDETWLLAIVDVCNACAGLPMCDKLDILQLAWGVLARQARNGLLGVPGGFPEEKSRQLEQLRKTIELVEADEPDLEMERLSQEDDLEGLLRHVRRILGKRDDEKGGA
jgi:hypothetical protein